MDSDQSTSQEPKPQAPDAKGGGFLDAYRRWADKWGPYIFILLFGIIFLVIVLFHHIFIFIHPGEQGVLWRRIWGTDLEYAYTEGVNLIWPWNKMYIYDVRTQHVNDQFHVLSKDGLQIELSITIRFSPQRDSLPFLHVEVGPEYVERIVKPEIQAALRVLMGQYTPDEIYTSQDAIIRRAVETAQPELLERHVLLDDLLIKTITLPAPVRESIESKLRQQQAYLEYEFRLQREQREKERKVIEAEGIKQFQSIIQEEGGSFSRYLDYLGIQATLALSTSPNAKVVLIGNKDNGLPLILNLSDYPSGDGKESGAVKTNAPQANSTSASMPSPNTGVGALDMTLTSPELRSFPPQALEESTRQANKAVEFFNHIASPSFTTPALDHQARKSSDVGTGNSRSTTDNPYSNFRNQSP